MPTDAHSELLLLVGRIDGKMDTLIDQAADHGHRLSSLEAWKNRALGLALGSGALAGGLAAKLAPLLGGLPPAH